MTGTLFNLLYAPESSTVFSTRWALNKCLLKEKKKMLGNGIVPKQDSNKNS